jgi:hypothetical protein
MGQNPLGMFHKLLPADRLSQQSGGTQFSGGRIEFRAGLRGDHADRKAWVPAVNLRQQIETAFAGHAIVAIDQVKRKFLDFMQCLIDIGRASNIVTFTFQYHLHGIPAGFIVIDYKYYGHLTSSHRRDSSMTDMQVSGL